MQSFIYPSYLRDPGILGVTVYADGDLPIPPHYDESELFNNIWNEVSYIRELTDVQLAVYLNIVRVAAFQAGCYCSVPEDSDE